jgi:hypothetical protein
MLVLLACRGRGGKAGGKGKGKEKEKEKDAGPFLCTTLVLSKKI